MRKTVVLMASMALAVLLASGVALLAGAPGAEAAPTRLLYPNLKTLKPKGLRFDTETINGTTHDVLRFTNTVWNSGQGPLDLRGKTVDTPSGKKTRVYQRVYDAEGNRKMSEPVGLFVYHPAPDHDHFHFGDFAEYQLWTRRDYKTWVERGRRYQEQYEEKGTKTTFCVYDTTRVDLSLPYSPHRKGFTTCTRWRQGLSVGWGDSYGYWLADQWIDLGPSPSPLRDGRYVLRSVADPKERIYESRDKRSKWRESRIRNAAIKYFRVEGGDIVR
jgi:lysyl oxidase